MKRRNFLIASGVVLSLILKACKGKNKLPKTPTILSGYMTNDNEDPLEGLRIEFGGTAKEIGTMSTFSLNTLTDEKGYYYFEQLIPEDTMSITFKVIDISN